MKHCSTELLTVVSAEPVISKKAEDVACILGSKLFRVLEQKDDQALIFNAGSTIGVRCRTSLYGDTNIVGQIVNPIFNQLTECKDGYIEINRLSVYQRPEANVNLFELIPFDWVKDRQLIQRGFNLIETLPIGHRLLFNAIFWDAGRLELFCRLPSSIIGHHSEANGNLRHTIEVAEEMRNLCLTRSYTNVHLGVLAALLHDCGKAEEYQQKNNGDWRLSIRGKLLGHKVTVVEWIVAAINRYNIKLPLDHYEGLLHMLTAVPNAQAWTGLRPPLTPESLLLSMADRLSGHDDLMIQTLPDFGGFGRYHQHLNAAPFKVRG